MRLYNVLWVCIVVVLVNLVAGAISPLAVLKAVDETEEEYEYLSQEVEENEYWNLEEGLSSNGTNNTELPSTNTMPTTSFSTTKITTTTSPNTTLTSTTTTTTTTTNSPSTSTSTTNSPSTSTSTTTIKPEPTLPPNLPTPTPLRTYNLTVGELGIVEGIMLKSFKNRDFYGFLSLPYAKPPVRFEYSEPWTEPLEYYDATYLRPRCSQGSMLFSGIISGTEDCLHLSVYTPLLPEDLEEKDDLAVMVFIHGGAYTTGDAFLYLPTKLMDKDVVVVVVQYRLGLLGFLAGGIKEAPGNMGLMDQIQALRWVQKHIHDFGGNPDLVTVFGQSAGGASSSWMYLTPLTQDTVPENNGRQLLHRVIPQSGSALEEWTLDKNPKSSFDLTAAKLGCTKPTPKAAVKCMNKKTHQEVVTAGLEIYIEDRERGGLGFRGLSPVIQNNIEKNVPVVIPKDPRDILENGEFLRIPVMTGSVRDEGSLVVGLIYKDFMVPNNHTSEDEEFLRNEALPILLNAFGIDDKTASLCNSMKLAYMPDAVMGNWSTMVGGMIDMVGVMFLKSGLWEVARRSSITDPDSKIFFYSWEFESDDSLFPWIFFSFPHVPVPGGVSHVDELLYLFHLPAVHDERQQLMVDRMTKIWTNFAKYGDPTPDVVNHTTDEWEGEMEKWLPYNTVDKNFMLMQDNLTMDLDYATRWRYHSSYDTEPTNPPPMPDMVSRQEYEDMMLEKENFQIATGVLGALCGCCLILFIVLYIRKRRKLSATV